jgi:hypothetical protein
MVKDNTEYELQLANSVVNNQRQRRKTKLPFLLPSY